MKEVLSRMVLCGRICYMYQRTTMDKGTGHLSLIIMAFFANPSSVPFGQVQVSKMNQAADKAHFLIAYPEGLLVNNPVAGVGPGWNVPGLIADQDDIAFSNSLIDHVAADFTVDLDRVHASGWSLGAAMAFYTACNLADRIASVAGVADHMTEPMIAACTPGRSVSTMVIDGTADPITPFTGIPGIIPPTPATPSFWASNNNCSTDSVVTEVPDRTTQDSSTVTVIKYVDCDDRSQVVLVRVNNGGHPWPGGGALPAFMGNQNMDFRASEIILKFFKRNPHPNRYNHEKVVGENFDEGSVENTSIAPLNFSLEQNYPNPFNPIYQYSVFSA